MATLTISSGGTYAGGTYDAVVVRTAAPVTVTGMTINHAGTGIEVSADSSQVTVSECTITAVAPVTPGDAQYAIRTVHFSSVDIRHCEIRYGHGIWLNNTGGSPVSHLVITCNNFTDISRMSHQAEYVGAVHGYQVNAPGGAAVTWNRVTNHYGQSVTEDVFSFTASGGAAGHPVYFGHNLVNGQYPAAGGCTSGTGTGGNYGDIGGSWITSQYNTAVRVSNTGFQIPAGHDITIDSCTVISSGYADNGTQCSTPYGGGIVCYDGYGGAYGAMTSCAVTNCTAGFLRWTGSSWQRFDIYLPAATASSGNTSLGHNPADADISAAISAFEASATAAGMIIGLSARGTATLTATATDTVTGQAGQGTQTFTAGA